MTDLIRVCLEADEMYPVLHISEQERWIDTDVPRELVDAVNRANESVTSAEEALLDWLHERQPKHPIFRRFPRDFPPEVKS